MPSIPENPFPGLRPYESSDSDLFFGREDQVHELLTRLRQARFLAVLGSSGCGKSSLIRAGLLPPLESGFMTESPDGWVIVVMRPGSDPVGQLGRALCKPEVFGIEGDEGRLRESLLVATLRRGSRGLVNVVSEMKLPADRKVLILVDQFEELFRFVDEDKRGQAESDARFFVSSLLAAMSQVEHAIYVVMTMRSEFLGDAALYPGLADAINRGLYLVPSMTREQLRDAITEPVVECGGEITNRLVNRLLNDLGDEQDQLPVLQHALMRLWTLAKQQAPAGQTVKLDVDLYDSKRIGGMRQTLPVHVKEIMDELTKRQKEIAEQVFRSLTQVAGNGVSLVRRPTRLGEIALTAGAEMQEVIEVIDRFRGEGKSFLMPPAPEALNDSTIIDISHESLIRQWNELRQWTKLDNESREVQKMLETEAEKLHEAEGTQPKTVDPAKFYLTGVRLEQALEWKRENSRVVDSPEFALPREFLRRSEEYREQVKLKEKAAQRLGWLVGISSFVAALFISGAVWLYLQRAALRDENVELGKEREKNKLKTARLIQKQEDLDREVGRVTALTFASASRAVAANRPISSLLYATHGVDSDHHPNVVPEARVQQGFVDAWSRVNVAGIAGVSLGSHNGPVTKLLVDPTGRRLFTASEDRTVGFWETDSAGRTVKRRTVYDHAGAIKAMSMSDDGRWLVSGDSHGAISIWRGSESQFANLPQSLPVVPDEVKIIEFSNDSQWLIIGSSTGAIRAWHLNDSFEPNQFQQLDDMPDGELSRKSGNIVDIVGVAETQTGTQMVAVGMTSGWRTGIIKVWNLSATDTQGRPILLPNSLKVNGQLKDVATDSDNQWLAAADSSGRVTVWNVQDIRNSGLDAKSFELEFQSKDESENSAQTPSELLSANSIEFARWTDNREEPSVGTSQNGLDRDELQVTVDGGSPDASSQAKPVVSKTAEGSTYILCGYGNGEIQRWRLRSRGIEPERLPRRRSSERYTNTRNSRSPTLQKIKVSPDGNWIASSFDNDELRLVRVFTDGSERSPIRFNGHDGGVTDFAFRQLSVSGPDGRNDGDGMLAADPRVDLLSVGSDGQLREWRLDHENSVGNTGLFPNPAQPDRVSTAWTKDARTFVAVFEQRSWDGKESRTSTSLWARKGTRWQKIPLNQAPELETNAFSSHAHLDIATTADHVCIAWVKAGKLYFQIGEEKSEPKVLFDSLVSTMSNKSKGSLIDHGQREIKSIAFSANGAHLAAILNDGSIYLWMTKNLDEPKQIPTNEEIVLAQISQDFKTVALVPKSNPRMVRVWSIEAHVSSGSGRIDGPEKAQTSIGDPRNLSGHGYEIKKLDFDESGKSLISTDETERTNFWDLTQSAPVPQTMENEDDSGFVKYWGANDLSPDGRWLARSIRSGQLEVRKTDPGRGQPKRGRRWILGAPSADRPSVVTFSRDSRWLWVGWGNGSVQGWKMDGPLEPEGEVEFIPPNAAYWNQVTPAHIEFSAQDHAVVVMDVEGTLRNWPLDLIDVGESNWSEMKNRVAELAGRNLTIEEWKSEFASRPYKRTFDTLPVHSSVLRATVVKILDDASETVFDELVSWCEMDPEMKGRNAQAAKQHASDLVGLERAWRMAMSPKEDWKRAKQQFALLSTDIREDLDPERLSKRIAVLPIKNEGRHKAESGELDAVLSLIERLKSIDSSVAEVEIPQYQRLFKMRLAMQVSQLATAGDVAKARDSGKALATLNSDWFLTDEELGRILFENALSQARQGEFALADRLFAAAGELDASMADGKQLEEAKRNGRIWLVSEARRQAMQGNRDEATRLVEAASNDAAIPITNPHDFVDRLIARKKIQDGLVLARSPRKQDQARIAFEEAKLLDPEGYQEVEPGQLAARVAASVMLKNARQILERSLFDQEKARYWFVQAKELDATLNYSPDTVVQAFVKMLPNIHRLEEKKSTQTWKSRLELVQAIETESLQFAVADQTWNLICWQGCLDGQAVVVRTAGDAALRLDPSNPSIRDTRGLVRAMTGDVPGAIRDFEYFVIHTDLESERSLRQAWLERLRKGDSPADVFNSDALEELKRRDSELRDLLGA